MLEGRHILLILLDETLVEVPSSTELLVGILEHLGGALEHRLWRGRLFDHVYLLGRTSPCCFHCRQIWLALSQVCLYGFGVRVLLCDCFGADGSLQNVCVRLLEAATCSLTRGDAQVTLGLIECNLTRVCSNLGGLLLC